MRETLSHIDFLAMQCESMGDRRPQVRRLWRNATGRKYAKRAPRIRFRKVLRCNELRRSIGGSESFERTIIDIDSPRNIHARSAHCAAARIEARSCNIVAAIRRDLRCVSDQIGDARFAQRRCFIDARPAARALRASFVATKSASRAHALRSIAVTCRLRRDRRLAQREFSPLQRNLYLQSFYK
jgi:hypothetical protein